MKKFLKVILRLFIIIFVVLVMVIVGCVAGVMYTRWEKDNQEIINESGEIIKVGDNIVIEENVTCLFMGVNGALTEDMDDLYTITKKYKFVTSFDADERCEKSLL